jgi:hypothetical protein
MNKNFTYKQPEEVGINPDKLKELDNALNYQLGTIKSVFGLRDDSIVYERYLHGCQKENTHNVSCQHLRFRLFPM